MPRRTRREFLRDASVAAAMIPIAARSRRAHGQPAPGKAKPGELPCVIATWDYGLALCSAAQAAFARGGDLLDALERGTIVVEDDPNVHSVGYNGLPNEDGTVQLDATMMDGRTHRSGSVGALERIRNPISVARKVMEKTHHALLVGAGANQFARKLRFPEQDLLAPAVRAEWEQSKKTRKSFWRDERHDTVCSLAIDSKRDIAVAVSTSGLAGKLAGRLGDSPIVGAGCYVDNDIGGAAATGIGELAIRNAASFAIVERMRSGVDPTAACTEILQRIVAKHPEIRSDSTAQLAFIALAKSGEVGAAALRPQKKVFRYALVRGTTTKPVLVEVSPLLPV